MKRIKRPDTFCNWEVSEAIENYLKRCRLRNHYDADSSYLGYSIKGILGGGMDHYKANGNYAGYNLDKSTKRSI